LTAPPGDLARLRLELLAILDEIEHEIMYAYVYKRIYTEMRDEITERRADSDATFLNSYSHLYARGQVMMIRRLADRGDDKPRSLWWVIERIRKNPAIGSRSALLEPIRQKHPDDQFFVTDADRVYSQRFGEGNLPSDEPLAELQARLLDELVKVIEFADRHVAHRDPRGSASLPTYAEIHAAIDHVAAIVNEINMVLRYKAVAFDDITIQGDWQAVFRPTLFPLDPSVYYWPDQPGYT
jgi:hypothetical protein